MNNDLNMGAIISGDNNGCIEYIVDWYKTSFNLDNVTYKYDDKSKTYSFMVNNVSIGEVNDDLTLSQATIELGKQYDVKKNEIANELTKANDSGYQKYVGGTTNKKTTLSESVKFEYDPEEIHKVFAILNSLERNAPKDGEIKSLENTINGKLKQKYNESDNKISSSDIKNLETIFNEYKLKVKYSFEMLENTDKEARTMLASIIDEIFNFQGNAEYNQKNYEEKKKYLETMLTNTNDMIYQLEQAFKEKGYDLGVPLSENTYNVIFPFAEALGISMHEDNNVRKNGQAFVNPEGMNKLIACINDDNLFENIGKYLKGEKFEDTLLNSFIKCSADPIKSMEDENYLKELKENAEKIFITRYVDPAIYIADNGSYTKSSDIKSYLDSWDEDLWDLYSRSLGPNGFNVKYIDDVSDEYVDAVKKLMAINYTDTNGKFYVFKDEISTVYNDYSSSVSDLMVLKEYKKELQKEIKLLPFNANKDNVDFWKYYAANYTQDDINKVKDKVGSEYRELIDYCTQEEFALIMYYLNEVQGDVTKTGNHVAFQLTAGAMSYPMDTSYSYQVNKGVDKANNYLYNIWDTLNMRKGFDEAYKVVSSSSDLADLYNYTIGAGIDGVSKWLYDADNTLRMFSAAIDSNVETKPTGYTTYKSMFINSMLEAAKMPEGMRGELEKDYPGLLDNVSMLEAELGNFSYTMFNQAGNMLIPMVLGSLTGVGTVGSALVGVGAAGSAAASAVSRGETNKLTILTYGTLNGLSEAILTQTLSSLPGIGQFFKEGRSFLSNCTGEAKEEFLQAFIESGLNTAFFGDEFDFGETFDEAKLGAFYGFMLSAAINGSVGSIRIKANGNDISLNSEQSHQVLKSAGNDISSIPKLAAEIGDVSTNITDDYKLYIREHSAENDSLIDRIKNVWYSSKNGKIYVETVDGGTYTTDAKAFETIYQSNMAEPQTIYDGGIDEFVDELIADGIDPKSPEWESRIKESAIPSEMIEDAYNKKTSSLVSSEGASSDINKGDKVGPTKSGSDTDSYISDKTQTKLNELKTTQENLELERSALEKEKNSRTLTPDESAQYDAELRNIDKELESISKEKSQVELESLNELDAAQKNLELEKEALEKEKNSRTLTPDESAQYDAELRDINDSIKNIENRKTQIQKDNEELILAKELESSQKEISDLDKAQKQLELEKEALEKEKNSKTFTPDESTKYDEELKKVDDELSEIEKRKTKLAEENEKTKQKLDEVDKKTPETDKSIEKETESIPEKTELAVYSKDALEAVEDLEAEGLTPSDAEGQQLMSERTAKNDDIEKLYRERHPEYTPADTSSSDSSHDSDVETDLSRSADTNVAPETESDGKINSERDVNAETKSNPNINSNENTTSKKTNILPYITTAIVGLIGTIGLLASPLVSNNTGLTLTLLGDNPMTITQGSEFKDPGATATDETDGDITSSIKKTPETIDTSKIGEYTINYSITNSKGDTATKDRVVKVVKKSGGGGSGGNSEEFIIKQVSGIPKKYKLVTNGRDTLTNITIDFTSKNNTNNVNAIGMNMIADGTNYNDLLTCDSSLLGKEASLVSIYNGVTLSNYRDTNCFSNRGIFYFKTYGSMIITNVTTKNEYDSVVNNKPNDTFIYQNVLVQNNTKATSSVSTTNNIAFCATGSSYQVFIPQKDVTLSDYADKLVQNSCYSAVLLPGNGYIEYRGRVDYLSTYGTNTFDSIMYFN